MAMCSPSSDQVGVLGVTSTLVTCVTAPPSSIQRTNTSGLSLASADMNRMRLPSGNQRAFEPPISGLCRLPSASMILNVACQLSFILSK